MDIPKCLKVAQVAEIMQCHPTQVYRLIRTGALPSVPVGKTGVRVLETAVIEYLQTASKKRVA